MPTDLDRTLEALRIALVYSNTSAESYAPHTVRLSAARFLRTTLLGVVDDPDFWTATELRARATADMAIDRDQLAELICVLQDFVGAELAVALGGAGHRSPSSPPVGTLITEVQQLLRLDPAAARQLGDVRVALKEFVEQLHVDDDGDEPRAVRRWLHKGRAVAGTLVILTFRTASLHVDVDHAAMRVGADQEQTADAVMACAGISAVREALAASHPGSGLGSLSAQRMGVLAGRVLRRVSARSPQLDVEEKLLAAQQRAFSDTSAPDSTPRYAREVIDILKFGHGREARQLRRSLEKHEDAPDPAEARTTIDRTVDRLRLRASWEERTHAWEERIKAYMPWRSGSGRDAGATARADEPDADDGP